MHPVSKRRHPMPESESMTGLVRALSGVAAAALVLFVLAGSAHAHGDVKPQAVDASGLPKLGDDWLEENPWRDPKGEHWTRAVEVGRSGYNQNCARCHGLQVVSGGLAPDLRFLEANLDGDEWYLERYQVGYTQNGITKMPAFGELLGQEAAWAIRTYIETRPDEGALDDFSTRLKEIRDTLKETSDPKDQSLDALRKEMQEIAAKVETGSGAPIAVSPASLAANTLNGTADGLAKAVDALTVGLSAAK